MKVYSLKEVTDELVGKPGTPVRQEYDSQLEAEVALAKYQKTCTQCWVVDGEQRCSGDCKLFKLINSQKNLL